MSSQHGTQDPLGRYYTPDEVAQKIVALPAVQRALDVEVMPQVLEPSAGGGAFVRALQALARPPAITAIDIDPEAPTMRGQDWASREGPYYLPLRQDFAAPIPGDPRFDLAIGNPPFGAAERHIRRAHEAVRDGGTIVLLLRLAMLESRKRRDLWRDCPLSEVHVLEARPSFTGGGTDSAAYAAFVWRPGSAPVAPTLGWIR